LVRIGQARPGWDSSTDTDREERAWIAGADGGERRRNELVRIAEMARADLVWIAGAERVVLNRKSLDSGTGKEGPG